MMLLADRPKVRYHPLPKFPTAVRDVALLIDTGVQFADVERAIKGLMIPELVKSNPSIYTQARSCRRASIQSRSHCAIARRIGR